MFTSLENLLHTNWRFKHAMQQINWMSEWVSVCIIHIQLEHVAFFFLFLAFNQFIFKCWLKRYELFSWFIWCACVINWIVICKVGQNVSDFFLNSIACNSWFIFHCFNKSELFFWVVYGTPRQEYFFAIFGKNWYHQLIDSCSEINTT